MTQDLLFRAKKLVYKEIDKLLQNKISQALLNRSKRQIVGQVYLAQENRESTILSSVKQFMTFSQVSDINETIEKYMAITADEVLDVAQKYFSKPSALCVLAPKKYLEEANLIC